MADVTYREHVAYRKKEALGAEAEYQGFLMALTCTADIPPVYSHDEYLERRYRQGFEDGRIVLAVEREGQR